MDNSITIGAIVGTTGEYSWVGENYVKGMILAQEKIMDENPQITLDLIVENDEFDPKKGLTAYEKLVSLDNIDALINETSSTIDVIYDKVSLEEIPVIQGGEQTSDASIDNIFQIQPGYYVAEVALGKYVKSRDYENVMLFVQNYPAMLKLAKGFRDGYGEEGIDEHLINPGEKYSTDSYALNVKGERPGAVVLLMFPDDGALLVKNIIESIRPIPHFIFDANFQSGIGNYENILGDVNILDGSEVMAVNMDTQEEFKKEYQERFGEEAGLGSDWGYDALNILVKTRDSEFKTWIKNIQNFSELGASGLVEFDSLGVRIPNYEMNIIQNGQLVGITVRNI